MSKDLIDTLAEVAGCEYISDLHRMAQSGNTRLTETLRATAPGDHPLKEWNALVKYLDAGSPQETPEQAKALLLERLCESKDA